MPTLIEKVLFANPPKYSKDNMHFSPTELVVDELNVTLHLDVVTPIVRDGEMLSPYVVIYAHSN